MRFQDATGCDYKQNDKNSTHDEVQRNTEAIKRNFTVINTKSTELVVKLIKLERPKEKNGGETIVAMPELRETFFFWST
jgi:hypothetical protein